MKTTIKMQISSNSSKISWPPDEKSEAKLSRAKGNSKLLVVGSSEGRDEGVQNQNQISLTNFLK